MFFFLFNIIRWFGIGLITTLSIFPYYIYLGIYCIVSKKKREDVGFDKPLIPIIMMILSLSVYFVSIFILTRWFVQNERIKRMSDTIIDSYDIDDADLDNGQIDNEFADDVISNNDISFIDVNFDNLLNRNPDTVGWIVVNGTYINYPIVQSGDNSYYLEHDFNKYGTNVGWIFADYRSNFESFGYNTIVYGHNLINKTMFGSLPRVLKKSWYSNKNNQYIKTSSLNSKAVWQVFSVYEIEPVTDYLRTGFGSESDFYAWEKKMKRRSVYDFNIDIEKTDKVITLSTCNDVGNKRVVLHAKLINIEYK